MVDVNNETIRLAISKSIEVKTKLVAKHEFILIISEVIDQVVRVFKNDGKFFICDLSYKKYIDELTNNYKDCGLTSL